MFAFYFSSFFEMVLDIYFYHQILIFFMIFITIWARITINE